VCPVGLESPDGNLLGTSAFTADGWPIRVEWLGFPLVSAGWNMANAHTDSATLFQWILLSGLFCTRLRFERLRNSIGKALFVIEEKPLVSIFGHESSYQSSSIDFAEDKAICAASHPYIRRHRPTGCLALYPMRRFQPIEKLKLVEPLPLQANNSHR
jgi:hypothetical protein